MRPDLTLPLFLLAIGIFMMLWAWVPAFRKVFPLKKKIIYRENHEPYLIRYSLFACPWFAVKIHKILRSDDNCLHDHPWKFLTILLWGSYIEHSDQAIAGVVVRIVKQYKAGNILYRHLHYIHRLEIDKPVTSLVITFKKRKKWGFFTPEGWVEWFKYRPTGGCS
jgi:hypothetical protein